MATVIRSNWNELKSVIQQAEHRLVICSPFITEEGIGCVSENIRNCPSVDIWTRLSPSEWVKGVSDPVEISSLINILSERGMQVNFGIYQRLHAKAYAADTKIALIGSANLSTGGFENNLELMVKFVDREASYAISRIDEEIKPLIQYLSFSNFNEWIIRNIAAIEEIRKADTGQPEIYAPLQAQLDQLLEYGRDSSPNSYEPVPEDKNRYQAWLENHYELSGALILHRRSTNADGQNLTGHFSQCFYAAFRFCFKFPHLCEQLAEKLMHLDINELFNFSEFGLSDSWIEYLDSHAMDQSEYYNYSVLRGILPPSLGGTVLGGGGGSSTLKRMLPLVAKFILENYQIKA